MISVFVSSRFQEFEALRTALVLLLEASDVFEPLALDDGAAAAMSTRERSVGTVADAQVMVLLLGLTYADEASAAPSPTHQEFRRAQDLGLPILAYRSAGTHTRGSDLRAMQFIEEVEGSDRYTVGRLPSDPHEAAAGILRDLEQRLLWQGVEVPDASERSRFADFARYVGAEHVEGLGLRETRAQQIRGSGETPAQGSEALLGRLLQMVAVHGFQFDDKPLEVGSAARITHPSGLVTSAGSRLDLTTLLASVCLAHDLHPILAFGLRGRRVTPWLVVRTGEPDEPVMAHVDAAQLAADVHRDVEERVSHARETGQRLRDQNYETVVMVDVIERHRQGAPPFLKRPHDQLPAITRWLPPIPAFRTLGGHRAAILDELCASTGVILITGPSGTGKSMLALKAAGEADDGYGWFLSGSSEADLILSLAHVEAAHRGELISSREAVEKGELEVLAHEARRRLGSSRVPWAVVIDNADVPPDKLRRWLPEPDARRGQKLYVTTTDRDPSSGIPLGWSNEPHHSILVEPLSKEELAALRLYPESLRVEGSPLLAFAWEAFLDTERVSITALARAAEEFNGASDGADVFWRCVRGRLSTAELRLTLRAALAPPDEISFERVTAAATTEPESTTQTAEVEARLDRLAGLGLLQTWWSGTARLHRRFGKSIRGLAREEMPSEVLEAADSNLEAGLFNQESLLTMAHLVGEGEWSAEGPVVENRGRILHRIGTLLEPLVGANEGATWMRRAHATWEQAPAGQQADRLHVEARLVFQRNEGRLSDLGCSDGGRPADGLRFVEASLRYREGAIADASDPGESHDQQLAKWRSVALRGLLLILIGQEDIDDAAARATMDEGRDLVDRSRRERQALLAPHLRPGQTHPDLLRAEFNQAFAAVGIARDPRLSRDQRLAMLTKADDHYENVRVGRQSLPTRVPAHIAACHHGRAEVDYLRAITPGTSPRDARALIRRANTHLTQAMDLRESYEVEDGTDVGKTARLEVRIAAKRWLLSLSADHDDQLEVLLEGISQEIRLMTRGSRSFSTRSERER